jgi:hypothetical protein
LPLLFPAKLPIAAADLTLASRQDESQMEEEARAPSQAKEKKDEGSLVSFLLSCLQLPKANNYSANKLLAPQSQLPPQF